MKHTRVKMLAWLPLMLASAAAAVYCWELPPRPISLRVTAASSDQLRITWDRASAPALLARGGALEIQDAGILHRLDLSAPQVRGGSVTYERASGQVSVRFTVVTGDRWAGLRDVSETAEFRGAAPIPLQVPPASAISASLPPAAPKVREPSAERADPGDADRVEMPRRAAVIPQVLPSALAASDSLAVPAPPSLAIPQPVAAQLPIVPSAGTAPAPPRPVYSGPRSGRLIWTGSMERHGVVEIEGSHSSVGSLAGGLPGVPVTIRVATAEFSSEGLVVHTPDAAADGRREAPSAANGWNATFFQWMPDRARELVVLEAPNPTNDYERLVVRNDARACSVMLVEWSVRAQ